MNSHRAPNTLDLPQVDLMNFRVEYVLNKQDEGLFGKSNNTA